MIDNPYLLRYHEVADRDKANTVSPYICGN